MGWVIHDKWDHAIDGTAANVDFTGLAGATEILIIVRLVTKSASTFIWGRVSTDDGVSYYSASGDYKIVPGSGSESDSSGALVHSTNATAARNATLRIHAPSVDGAPKLLEAMRGLDPRLFVASEAPVNAVRIVPDSGNFTGGVITCLARF